MTLPLQEWAISSTGPSELSIARLVTAASAPSDVRGSWTATTFKPLLFSSGISFDRLEPSAQAP